MTTVLDPTSESRPEQRELVPRPESLDGLTIGLLDISKPVSYTHLTLPTTPYV